jgi:hypothetical protein
MVEAARTTGSPAAIWAIVVVAVVLLAFWLAAVMLADRSQVRTSGRARMLGAVGPVSGGAVSGGTWTGGSVAGQRAEEIPGEPVHEPIGAPGGRPADGAAPPGETPTRADIPAQAGQPADGRRPLPAQRTGDADRAARSHARPGTQEDDEPGR